MIDFTKVLLRKILKILQEEKGIFENMLTMGVVCPGKINQYCSYVEGFRLAIV